MSFQDIKLNLKTQLNNNKFYQVFINLPKKNLLITLLITLSIPITLTLAQQQQTIQQNAASPAEAQTELQEIIQEDNLPDDIIPYTDPQIAQKEYDLSMEKLNSLESQLATTQKPNIVVIMLDDVNPIDGRFFTQNRMPATYNNIISKGINFTNFYGETSLCCPGRVGFLTGQHTQNHGVADLDGTKFNPTTTIATELQAKGYFTMLTGKYVNYYTSIPKAKAIPPGWNKFDAIYSGQGRYFNYDWISKKSGFNNTEFTITHYDNSPSDYSTDVITKTAVSRLKEAPSNMPIFAYLTPYAIHDPKTVAPRYINDSRCQNIEAWKAPNVWEQDISDKSNFFEDLRNGNPTSGFSLKRNCEVLLAVDDLVRQVKNELQRQNRLKNTIFILTADNGYGFGEHRIPAKTSPFTTHIPLYIAWPEGRGATSMLDSTILSNIDLASTFCDLAGCVMGPYPNGQSTSDGISFLSLIKNQPANFTRHSILESQPIKPIGTDGYTRPTWWAIRTTEQHPLGKWHYIEYATGENELYDLSNEPCYLWTPDKGGDPCELNNLIRNDQSPTPQSQDLVNQLKIELELLKQQKGFTPPPTPIIPTNSGITSATRSFISTADAYTRNDTQSINYGTNTFMRIDGTPEAISYIKFDLSSLKGKIIEKAILKIAVSSNSGANANLTLNPINIKTTSSSWSENGLTYNNKPSLGPTISSITGKNPVGAIIEIDVTSGVSTNIFSFGIESSNGSDGLSLNTKESNINKPELIITYK